MNTTTERLMRGAFGGAVATVAMSAAMLAAQKVGRMGAMPPTKITRRLLMGLGIVRPKRVRRASVGLHVAFGTSAGVLYALFVAPRRKRSLRSTVRGTLFGAAVWAASYAGWILALGIMAPPHRDRRGRPTAMLLSHVIYGATLGAAAREWRIQNPWLRQS